MFYGARAIKIKYFKIPKVFGTLSRRAEVGSYSFDFFSDYNIEYFGPKECSKLAKKHFDTLETHQAFLEIFEISCFEQ